MTPTIKTYNPAEEAFLDACIAHDLTHEYSDDHGCWRAGSASLGRLHRMTGVDKVRVAEIWNAVVDTKLVPDAREQFYWRAP